MSDPCNCIELTNEALRPHNTELGLVFSMTGQRPTTVGIETALIEKKRGARPVRLLATHCPFCGVPYEPQP